MMEAIIEMLKNDEKVADIELKRGTVSKEVDGWKVVEPSDEIFVSFTYKTK